MMEDIYELIDKLIGMHSKARDVLIKYRDAMKISKRRIDEHLLEDLKMIGMSIDNDDIVIEEKEEIKNDIKEIKEAVKEMQKRDKLIKWLVGALIFIFTCIAAFMQFMNKLSIKEIIEDMKKPSIVKIETKEDVHGQ